MVLNSLELKLQVVSCETPDMVYWEQNLGLLEK